MSQVRDAKSLAVHSLSTLTTDIVVDLGCVAWQRGQGLEDSISQLVKRFQPTVLFGFDPHPGLKEGIGKAFGSVVMTSQRAAWIFDGQVYFELQGNCTHVTPDGEGRDLTPCFDLARWLLELPKTEIVLKMDVEGAEYVLLPHLIARGAMKRVSRLLIEWHTGHYANGLESDPDAIIKGIDCPIEEWQ